MNWKPKTKNEKTNIVKLRQVSNNEKSILFVQLKFALLSTQTDNTNIIYTYTWKTNSVYWK